MIDRFEVLRRGEGCLSEWQIAKFVSAGLTEQARSHMEGCQACQSSFQQAWAAREAAGLEPIPEALRPAGRQRYWWLGRWRRLAPLMAGVCAAVVLAFVIRPPPPLIGTKGSLSINIALKRAGRVIVEDVPLNRAPPLRIKDQVRVRAIGLGGRHVLRLEAQDGARRDVLYTGKSDPSGWLPIGLELTPGDNAMRLSACFQVEELELDAADCRRHPFSLKVSP